MNGLEMGKLLIGVGIGIAFLGLIIIGISKLLPLGELPGDIFVKGEYVSFYFPIVSCIVVSVIFSILLNLF